MEIVTRRLVAKATACRSADGLRAPREPALFRLAPPGRGQRDAAMSPRREPAIDIAMMRPGQRLSRAQEERRDSHDASA